MAPHMPSVQQLLAANIRHRWRIIFPTALQVTCVPGVLVVTRVLVVTTNADPQKIVHGCAYVYTALCLSQDDRQAHDKRTQKKAHEMPRRHHEQIMKRHTDMPVGPRANPRTRRLALRDPAVSLRCPCSWRLRPPSPRRGSWLCDGIPGGMVYMYRDRCNRHVRVLFQKEPGPERSRRRDADGTTGRDTDMWRHNWRHTVRPYPVCHKRRPTRGCRLFAAGPPPRPRAPASESRGSNPALAQHPEASRSRARQGRQRRWRRRRRRRRRWRRRGRRRRGRRRRGRRRRRWRRGRW